jgi:glycosyltransferase involved in cell wall biosynthesis
MKILLVHNHYQRGGGEDVVVAAELELLQAHGHDVRLVAVSNDEVQGFVRKLRVALRSHYSWQARRQIAQEIASFKPDIAHVHNFFPLLTPSIYDACRDAGVPVVQTLHNYRTICPAALLQRDGQICELCLSGSPYQAVLRLCYRSSLLGSLAVARMVDYHRQHGTWRAKVDCFIALTECAKVKFVEAGFPVEKIVVKPNFMKSGVSGEGSKVREGALFVGRLSHEKGVKTLLAAWHSLALPLRVVGEGPLLDSVRHCGLTQVVCLGRKTSAEVAVEMGKAAFLVMPSEWYEGFPMVLVEAYANGLPVIASRLGSMAEIIQDGETGLLFAPGNAEDLAGKVRWAAANPEQMRLMGEKARQVYEEKYTPEANYRQLMEIYARALGERGKGGNGEAAA